MTLARWITEFVSQHEFVFSIVALAILGVTTLYRNSNDLGNTTDKRLWSSESLYLLSIAIAVTLLRAPTWAMGETNLDEAQWLAGTLTLDRQFAFWGRVDTMTSGPLNIHFFWLWTLIAGEHTFQSTKVLTTLVWILVTCFTYASLRQIGDPRSSRLIVAPFAIAVGLMRLPDYVGYNGEQLPILLLAASLYFIFRADSGKPVGHAGWAIVGLMLGALPYTKLQAVPIGVFVGCWALVLLWKDRKTLTLVTAVLAVQIAVWSTLWMSGQTQDYWIRCVLQSLDYSQNWSSLPFIKRFYVFPIVWMRIVDARWFVVTCGLIVATSLIVRVLRSKSIKRSVNGLMIGTLGYLLITAYCVTQPGNYFTHYYLLLLHPIFLCAAVLVSDLTLTRRLLSVDMAKMPTNAVFLGGCALLFVSAVVPGMLAANSTRVRSTIQASVERVHPATELVRRISGPNTVLSIWGWNPRLHVDTQLPQATSEALTYHQITPSDRQEYYLERFVEQLGQQRDVVFVDITGPGGSYAFTEEAHDHGNFEAVKRLVDERLEYVETVGGARVYRSRATVNP